MSVLDADDGGRQLPMRHGRTLVISSEADGELLEVRGASGMLELRLELTERGVHLHVESARISLKAAESVEVDCKTFQVNAAESVEVSSGGSVRVSGNADVRVESDGDVRVNGAMVYLN
jgi:hypothetical protein